MKYMMIMTIYSTMSMCMWRHNLIMMLLSMELMLLTTMMSYSLFSYSYNTYFLMIFLTIMVISSSLGLGLLVSMSRTHYSTNSSFIWSMNFDNNYTIFDFLN